MKNVGRTNRLKYYSLNCTVLRELKQPADLTLKNIKVIRSDVFKFIDLCTNKFDFIFAGPPYALQTIDELPRKIFAKELLKPCGWFILEHTPRNNYGNFPFFKSVRNYGTTLFSTFINLKETI